VEEEVEGERREGAVLRTGGAMVRQTWRRRRLAWALATVLTVSGGPALQAVGMNGLAPLTAAAPPAESQGPSQADQEREAEEARRALEIFLRREKITFRQGEFSFELDAFYSTDTRDAFVRVIDPNNASGTRVFAQIQNTQAFGTAIGRYGLIDDLELDLIIPFGYAQQELESGFTSSRTDAFGLGDIAGRLRYQLWDERGWRPDVILDFDVKSRTASDSLLGTDHWSLGGSLTLVKTVDPVVFFGRAGYLATLERGNRDPGDIVLYELGMGFSLNDRVSYSMRVEGAVVGRLKENGTEIPGSSLNILNLDFAVTTRLARSWFIEPSVSIGVTDDAPDLIAGLSLVYRFWRRRL
jgi:Putative MetA-pathway of phenol degradation